MQAMLSISKETFLRLKRDRIFVPTVIFGILFSLFSSVVSDWGIEEFKKILYDFGTLGYELVGVTIAIFWGIKSISDSEGEGSLEVQLASPISRSTWLIGKYVGLVYGLLIISLILILFWQIILWHYDYSVFQPYEMAVFLLITLEWCVIGAAAFFLASMSSYPVALFSSIILWICGLISEPIARSLPASTQPTTKMVVEKFAEYWNLSKFHIVDLINQNVLLDSKDMILRSLYGLTLIGLLLAGACVLFRNKDLSA
jgi:ABC-type transport system involved in multi-copper enzyme maturation permease subunit